MIKVYTPLTDDFSGQGLGYIMPIKAEIAEEARGMYEIELEIPIDKSRDDFVIDHEYIISAPSPTRTSPEINFGLNGSIQRQIFRANASAQMYSLHNRKKKLKKYKKNTEFVRLDADGNWYKVSAVKGGATGWMKTSVLDFYRSAPDNVTGDSASTVVETVLAREQYFRVYGIKRDAANLRMIVSAEHISYDLRGVICASEYIAENIPADEAVAQILSKADQQDLSFSIFCQCTAPISGDYSGRNIIDCLLNPDDGIAVQCNARVIRDNFDIYILDPADRYTGADIRYGDNLTKAIYETDSSGAFTRIQPVGKNKDGDPLYITENGGYVDSPNAAKFAVPRTKRIQYAEAQTGRGDLKTDAKTRAKLKELAMQEFANGADMISAKINAEFVRRELAMEYTDLANEAALHMYDIAHVRADRAGIVASVRMTEYKFDALPGRERYIDTRIADLIDNQPMIYGSNIAGGSISGAKIQNNSIDGSTKIKDLTIGIGKFDVAAIDQLNANSITAVTAKIGEIVAGKITTDELFAALLNAVKLSAETGEFTFAEIKNLLADTLWVNKGVGNTVQIANLSVTEGNIVNLSVGNLLIRNEEGKMVRLYVDADGEVQTGDPIEDGTLSGEKIIEGSITTKQLNAEEIFANGGTIMNLISSTIRADEAFIGEITTTAIGNLSGMLELYVTKEEQKTYLRVLDDGVHVGKDDAASEVVVTPSSVDVRLSGATYSQFASNYVQFGNYQLRQSADKGLVFKLKKGE